jgi:predicted nucleotide-binding protein
MGKRKMMVALAYSEKAGQFRAVLYSRRERSGGDHGVDSMICHFQGPDGRRRLVEALKGNRLVEHDGDLAQRLAEKGELLEIASGQVLIEQGAYDCDIFFLIAGLVDVLVNGQYVATRGAGESIGEMALTGPASPRSATVVAKTAIVVVKLTEPVFSEIQAECPQIWKPIAQVTAERLRQRSQFHRPPNPQPVLFIGCSVESLTIANQIQSGLKHDRISTVVWHQGVFGPSGVTVDVLLRMAAESDFAAFVFGPDDKVVSRKSVADAPRDNVVFELGMFMGVLGRERTFIVKDNDIDIEIPSDLLGITPITYKVHDPKRLAAAVGPLCTELREAIQAIGVR